MSRPALTALCLLLAATVVADELPDLPVFADVRVIEGVRCFPSAADDSRWFYAPKELELLREGGRPTFALRIFRYTGTRTLEDQGEFWVRGIVTFGVRMKLQTGVIPRVQSRLSSLVRKRVTLLPIPLTDLTPQMVYSLPGGDSGTVAGGAWDEAGGASRAGNVWDGLTYTVSLDPYSASALWQAYHDGGALLAISVSAAAAGLPDHRQEGLPDPEMENRTVFSDSISINVTPGSNPESFAMIDINERMPVGYTFLDVYCYDFTEEPPPGVVKVVVEIKGTTVTDEPAVERVEFSAQESDYQRAISFRFAMDLDAGFSYRVTRLNQRGEASGDGWQRVDRWNGSIDVSLDRREDRRRVLQQMDPRDLYE